MLAEQYLGPMEEMFTLTKLGLQSILFACAVMKMMKSSFGGQKIPLTSNCWMAAFQALTDNPRIRACDIHSPKL